MTTIGGHCHCGAVRFEIESDLDEFTTCDCSLCEMRGAVMVKVHEDKHRLLAGADYLTEYRWNTGIARHFFCSACGIYVFHRKRAAPDHFGVNVRCLEGMGLDAAPIRATEGENMTVCSEGAQPHWPGPRI